MSEIIVWHVVGYELMENENKDIHTVPVVMYQDHLAEVEQLECAIAVKDETIAKRERLIVELEEDFKLLRFKHLPECNYPRNECGVGGCICTVVNKNYVNELREELASADRLHAEEWHKRMTAEIKIEHLMSKKMEAQ